MARKFLTSLVLVNLASDPDTGVEGELYFNTSSSVARIYKSGSWTNLDNTGGSSLTQEEIQDYVAPLFTNATNTNVIATYDDANNVINLNTSGSLVSVDSIVYPDYITFDTTPETTPTAQGSIYWDSGESAPGIILNSNVDLKLGQENIVLVNNSSGSTIPKGSVVYINGASGQRPTIALSDADTEATSSKTLGLTAESIGNGAEGFVTTFGVLRGVNTNGLTEGAALWLSSTAGAYTTTAPDDPAHLVFIGYVVKASSTSGEIFVNPQNGYELNELHNVKIEANGSLNDNEVVAYDSATGLWINQTANEADLVNISGTQTISGAKTFTNQIVANGNISSGSLTLQLLNNNAVSLNTSNNSAGLSEDTGFVITTHTASTNYLFTFKNNGKLQFPDYSEQLTAFLGMSAYSTTNLSEGTNLYYTDNRVKSLLGADLNGLNSGVRFISKTVNSDVTISNYDGTHKVTVNPSGSGTYVTGTLSILSSSSIGDSGNLSVNGNITASAIIKSGGTSSQFLKADGSVDSNTYLTTGSAASGYQPLDADLTAISAISGSSGILKKIGVDTWTLDTNTYLTTASAASIYLTSASATSLYQPLDGDLTSIAALSSSSVGLLKKSADNTWTIITDNSSNWNTAYGWGNHAIAGYLTSYTETDPVFLASTAYSITSGSVAAWNTAYSWGNHASYSYLTTTSASTIYQPLDADLTAIATLSSASTGLLKKTADNTWTLLTDNTSNWNTAYGWGNHATAGYLTSTISSSVSITNTTESTSKDTGSLVIDGGLGVEKNVYIGGSLFVQGTTTTINATNLTISDNMIYLNNGSAQVALNPDIGIAGSYNDGSYAHTGLFRDATDGVWKFFDGYTPEPDASLYINTSHASFALADIGADNATFSGSVSVGTITSGTWSGTAIGTTKGGTGLTSYTTGDLIYASATNTLSKLTAGTNGQVLTLAAGVPTWANAAGGSGGTYTVNATAPSSPTSGDRWLDTDTGIEYTYINDGNSSQWVELAPGGFTGPASAPQYQFSTTTTASDPGNGIFRYNNSVLSSVTQIYLDNLDADGNTRTNWYDIWDDSTSTIKGYLVVSGTSTTDSAVFGILSITVNSGYYTASVSYVSGGSSVPTDGTNHTVLFIRNGDKGDTGSTGSTGPTGPAATQTIVWNRSGTVSTGTGTQRFRFPASATLVDISAAIDTAPTGAALTFNVLKNGTAIATGVTISASANATASNVSNTTSMAAGDYLTINITQVGSTIAGSDLTVFVRYQ